MYSCSESCYHCSYFRISQNTVKSCFLNIENLTSKRKYSLCFSLSCTLCRTAGGITLDYKNFTIFRILIRTICKFTRKIKTIKCCVSSCKIPCFSCCFSCTLCKNRFFTYCFCHRRILFKEICQLFCNYAFNSSSCFAVTKFLLSLSFKLWVGYFDTYNCCQTFSYIFT